MASFDLKDIDLILFDSDGTVVDSEGIAAKAWTGYIREFGVDMTPEHALAVFRGFSMAQSVAEVERMRGAPLPEHFVPELRKRMAILLENELQPMPGARALLQALHDKGVPFCLASNGPMEKIHLCLSVTGLQPLFGDRVFSAYTVGKQKPEPDLFLHAASTLNADPARCLVVEDSLYGVTAGLAAGMHVIALQPHGRDTRLPAAVPVVGSLQEVAASMGILI